MRRSSRLPRIACLFALATGTLDGTANAQQETGLPAWPEIERRAAGQTVYFNAWGGDLAINRYLDWAKTEIRERHALELVHVKVSDIAEAVARILAERAAGRDRDGSVDLLWINGENFAALAGAGLLFGPWAEALPNAALIDWQGNPTTRIDATLPTAGFELPWGTATFTLFYDADRVSPPPRDPAALLRWIEAHPGRFSYPQPPAFLGTAFLKQLLLLLSEDRERLNRPPGDDFAAISAALWTWLDRAHAAMWRGGRLFPRSGPAERELMASGELDWMMAYNPAEASRAIRQQELEAPVGALHFSGGALTNSHFLAIPYNAGSKEGALLVADFLVSPVAQARKADPSVWGDPTVLDTARLAPADRSRFDGCGRDPALPAPPRVRLPEPHPDWSAALERGWLERYTR